MAFGSSHRGSKFTVVDERRRVMAMYLDFDTHRGKNEIIEIARQIAQLRPQAPKSLQDFIVVHGANLNPPYDDEIAVVVGINQWPDDQMNFQQLVSLVESNLEGSFETVEFKLDHIRAPYNIWTRPDRNRWTEVA